MSRVLRYDRPDLMPTGEGQIEDIYDRVILGLNEEEYDRRITFEKNCSCHISPPCENCLEHSRLFPEEY